MTLMCTDCCSFICLSWSYTSHVTPVCLLHSEKRGKIVLSYVFNMVFPTSLFVWNTSWIGDWLFGWMESNSSVAKYIASLVRRLSSFITDIEANSQGQWHLIKNKQDTVQTVMRPCHWIHKNHIHVLSVMAFGAVFIGLIGCTFYIGCIGCNSFTRFIGCTGCIGCIGFTRCITFIGYIGFLDCLPNSSHSTYS